MGDQTSGAPERASATLAATAWASPTGTSVADHAGASGDAGRFCRRKELIGIREALEESRFAKGHRPVLLRMAEAAVTEPGALGCDRRSWWHPRTFGRRWPGTGARKPVDDTWRRESGSSPSTSLRLLTPGFEPNWLARAGWRGEAGRWCPVRPATMAGRWGDRVPHGNETRRPVGGWNEAYRPDPGRQQHEARRPVWGTPYEAQFTELHQTGVTKFLKETAKLGKKVAAVEGLEARDVSPSRRCRESFPERGCRNCAAGATLDGRRAASGCSWRRGRHGAHPTRILRFALGKEGGKGGP